jgi:hypothetical protein
MRASTLLSWVALWALGFVRASVRARTGGCRSGSSLTTEKTWTHFKSHFAAAHRQHKQMQGETAFRARFHSANAAMTQNEDQMAEATIGAFANLATATTADRGMVAALIQSNSRLVKQLEETTSELRELNALFHQ